MDRELLESFKRIHRQNIHFGLEVQKLKALHGRSETLEDLEDHSQFKYAHAIDALAQSIRSEPDSERRYESCVQDMNQLQEAREKYQEIKNAREHIEHEVEAAYRRIGELYYSIMSDLQTERDE